MDKRTGNLTYIAAGDLVIIRKWGKLFEASCIRVTPTGQMVVLFGEREIRFNHHGEQMGMDRHMRCFWIAGRREDCLSMIQAHEDEAKRKSLLGELKKKQADLNAHCSKLDLRTAKYALKLVEDALQACFVTPPELIDIEPDATQEAAPDVAVNDGSDTWGWGSDLVDAAHDFVREEVERSGLFEEQLNLDMGIAVDLYVHGVISDIKMSTFVDGSGLFEHVGECMSDQLDRGFDGGNNKHALDDLTNRMDATFTEWMKAHKVKWPYEHCSDFNGPFRKKVAFIRWDDGDFENNDPHILIDSICSKPKTAWTRIRGAYQLCQQVMCYPTHEVLNILTAKRCPEGVQ